MTVLMMPSRPLVSADEIANPKLAELYTLWRIKAGTRIGPTRAEIVPAEFPKLLPHIFLIEVVRVDAGLDFRIRLQGQRIVEFFHESMRDKLMSDSAADPFYARAASVFEAVVREKVPYLRPLQRTGYQRRDYMMTEVVQLPLSDDGENVSFIFGAFEAIARKGAAA